MESEFDKAFRLLDSMARRQTDPTSEEAWALRFLIRTLELDQIDGLDD